MDFTTEKLATIESLIHEQDEKVLSKINYLLHPVKNKLRENEFLPVAEEELNRRIDASEKALRKGYTGSHSEVKKMMKSCVSKANK